MEGVFSAGLPDNIYLKSQQSASTQSDTKTSSGTSPERADRSREMLGCCGGSAVFTVSGFAHSGSSCCVGILPRARDREHVPAARRLTEQWPGLAALVPSVLCCRTSLNPDNVNPQGRASPGVYSCLLGGSDS